MGEIADITVLGITVDQWVIAAAIAGGAIMVATVIRWVALGIIRSRARRATAPGAEPGEELWRRTAFLRKTVTGFVYPLLVLAGFVAAQRTLDLTESTSALIDSVIVVLVSILFILFLTSMVREFFARTAESDSKLDLSRVRPLRSLAVFVIWVAGLLLLFDNLGFDITTVLAGLGIGGLAIALGAQVVFGDLFSYFVIVLDRPYEEGDFLVFGDVLGTVERIGVKTTRIRSLSGEQVIVSNSDLTQSRVRNFKRMETRRVVFRIGVEYSTPLETLREIPSLIRRIVGSEERVTFDRAHFSGFGESQLTFETVYIVLSPDYAEYMSIQERVNLEIVGAFQERNVSFAFPSRTVYLKGSQD